MPDIVFFTICGGANKELVDRQYNHLLGSIEYHAEMGRHIVLDNSPRELHRTFTKLPKSVTWIYEPIYGHGHDKLRQTDLLNRIAWTAYQMQPDAVVYTDCDEFWGQGLLDLVARDAKDSLINLPTLHVDINGDHYYFPHEYHRRIWDGKREVIFPYNKAKIEEFQNGVFEGNPQRHSIACPTEGMNHKTVHDMIHHHMKCFIRGGGSWDLGKKIDKNPPWPEPLSLWKYQSIEPLLKFL